MEPASSLDDPTSLWMIRAAELFPKANIEKDDSQLQVPFNELPGESVKYLGKMESGGILAMSNYRLFLSSCIEASIPLRLIEIVQIKEMFTLIISCKDAVTYTCQFSSSESCTEWHSRISLAIAVPEQIENLFAFAFHAYVSESQSTSQLDQECFNRLQHVTNYDDCFQRELERQKFDLKGAWRVSHLNKDFKLCSTYPKFLIVPACISDEQLQSVSSFRSSRRIPAVVYRHPSGAVIARSSQPEVGWLGWRNNKDEQLLKALADACSFDNGESQEIQKNELDIDSSDTSQTENVEIDKPKKILIVDARSYASAVTNRARGGGVECAEYYPSAEIQFMNLANIHVIRKSFQSLRQLCALDMDIPNFYSLLDKTNWLQHISGLLSASSIVINAIEKNNRPVLVHCSDGWDRTSQICSTAEICLDPFYRTIDGFRILIEREWLSFGHKFGDRCGHGVGSEDVNERCPVFLQWLDCIFQLHHQYPCSFEFSTGYLIKLAQHVHSCLFGTFLCNNLRERLENSIPDRTFSVWSFLSAPIYKNPLYQPNSRENILWPSSSMRSIVFWKEFYLGSLHTLFSTNNVELTNETFNDSGLVKTRSFNDLVTEIKQNKETCVRRLSDPSIVYDGFETKKIAPLFSNITDDAPQNGDNDNNNNNNNDDDEEEEKEEEQDVTDTIVKNDEFHVENVEEKTINIDEIDAVNNVIQNGLNGHAVEERRTVVDGLKEDNLTNIQREPLQNGFHHLPKFDTKKTKKESSSSSYESQFSTPAPRSYTPAALLERGLNVLSIDGLNHALSHENLRLQQLVYEHKLKEEALQHELQIMRLALLKSNGCQCNGGLSNGHKTGTTNSDEHPECNSENSVCSWEAVNGDEKGTITPWIPDNARTKCKNCQIEFWLGRRKHHCRKCLEIFCGDCTDNFAPLNENFQPPVRLCDSCFKAFKSEKEN